MSGFSHGYILSGANRHYYRKERTDISREAKKRLLWLDWYNAHGRNGRLTCRHFGISPDTFYRWKRRYKNKDFSRLETGSRRPHRVRQPMVPDLVVRRIRHWRERYPRWGKEKIHVLLSTYDRIRTSVSTVGRTLKRLKDTGQLREPLKLRQKRNRPKQIRPWARRKPKDYDIVAPGDLVQVDTLDQEILPGVRRKQFTARDYLTKFDVMRAYSRATSVCASLFLDHMEKRLPFPVKAIQIDGGSEFMGEFESECQKRHIRLFVLPPRSPKLNGSVERAQRTHTEEFYEVHEVNAVVEKHNRQLDTWEETYNYIRPHQTLGYLTPAQFLKKWYKLHPDKEAKVYGMY